MNASNGIGPCARIRRAIRAPTRSRTTGSGVAIDPA
jgi:hypothetical protein